MPLFNSIVTKGVNRRGRVHEIVQWTEGYPATLAALGSVVAMAILLRLHNLGGESLWGDEVVSLWQAKGSLAHVIWSTAHDNYPPLNNLAIFAAIKLFGVSEWSLRLPSAIFGVANIVALWWLGTITVGRTAGLIAAGMLTLSPFHLEYSQEGRMYSLLALAATLYAATCFHYLRAPSLKRNVWVSLAGLALVYSHPYGDLYWVVIALAFFVLSSTSSPIEAMRVWKVSNVAIAAGFAPWALVLVQRAYLASPGHSWMPPLTTTSVLTALRALVAGRVAAAGGTLFAGIVLVGLVPGVVGRLRKDVMVFYVWIVAPVVIGIMGSIVWMPVFHPRYVIGSLPPLLLLSAFGWAKYAEYWCGAILPATVVVLVLGAGSISLCYRSSWYPKNDFRSVATFLDEREQPADCILIVPEFETVTLNVYRRNSSCQVGARKITDLPAEIHASVLFGIFCSMQDDHAKPPDNPAAFVDELGRRGWRELDRTNFQGVLLVTFVRRHGS
jgi:mannosyltransferase